MFYLTDMPVQRQGQKGRMISSTIIDNSIGTIEKKWNSLLYKDNTTRTIQALVATDGKSIKQRPQALFLQFNLCLQIKTVL
jgi:hypothetical protein